MKRILAAALAFGLGATSALAQAFDTAAGAAWVYDHTSDTVLLSKNADTPLPPASMSKLMTLYLSFEAIAAGRLSVEEELLVSEHCAEYGGSSMFLRAGERVRVEDLLRGVIVLSGNDASCVFAEALSPDGSEAGFARMMTDRGIELGLTASTFANSNGWPAAGHRMTAHDLGRVADHIIRDYPTFYPLFGEQEFEFDGRVPANSQNRNPILGLGIGADGLKTGHTSEAGYGLVGSAKQGDRRIIFVITGMETEQQRREEAERITNWAFRQFAQVPLSEAGTRIADARVWMGAVSEVGLVLEDDLTLLMPVIGNSEASIEAVWQQPIEAPIAEGQELGELVVTREGLDEVRVPLVAQQAVPRGGFSERMLIAGLVLLNRFAPQAAAELDPAFEAGALAPASAPAETAEDAAAADGA
ncbi:D-alanyl-D-alanine carboxypeptidase family protein [Pseudoroseicyclus tamaricis]|uniref:serine-type D-Ala-D-Ala carboxypeptidase n=1 Tax=Pseudoroseicyclus tamaricis TaxID=2705421 RepID=A0A6B2JUZ0_9RHOB|nr:D-alanyl-D-alanine carboxypeptidase family protein [Pseudoroseicyclus tamaricis]NDU99993.1 D-alanyl-D-alanine carboxypeptidase [Pseudoroseicyclus tamaricis]